MLVSLNWLKQYVDIDGLTAEELAEKITRSGIEVDAVIDRSQGMTNVVVGYVVSKEKHPDADKLNVCQVEVGEGDVRQIICGAPNVAAGQKVIVALPGARLPGGIKIKKAKMRGQESNGMICSLQELGVEGRVVPKAYADGIYVLPEDAVPGSDALELVGLRDIVLELGLTPNRSDALSMLGVAYEVAAILSREVKLPEVKYETTYEKAEDYLKLRVEAKENPLYAAKVVKNVKIEQSPLWLQHYLMAAGVRPHNNVVDITNYILMEYGQPLHAFDYDALKTKEIVVRLANEGEKIVTLDDQERTLKAHNLVITNGVEPVAIAGVMGGANSEVTENTTTVVIESAYFDGFSVRRTSKEIGLRSDASARFEKGVDPNRVILAAERAAQLLAELAGGEVLEGTVLVDELDKTPTRVVVSPDFINARLGMKISLEDMLSILKRLQFDVEAANGLLIIDAPTRRQDIKIEEDIVEEIARLYGYDEIPMTLPEGNDQVGGLTSYQAKRRVARNFLEGAGLYQAVTYSLTSEELSQKYALKAEETTKLLMPMSEERSTLRQSLIPHLLESASYNVARNAESVALYEIGSVFLGKTDEGLPYEEEHVAVVVTGKWVDNAWQGEKVNADFFIVKGILEGLFEKLGLADRISYVKSTVDGLHPGQTADIFLDGEKVGIIGGLHPVERKNLDLKDTFVAELNLKAILTATVEDLVYTAVPRFPAMTRDIALELDRSTPAGEIIEIIRKAGTKLLKDVKVFDVYEGEKMAPGKKSVAFSLTYFDPERTLTDDEVVNAHEKVLKALVEAGAEVR
ncbi:phenylalanine--tRNA ligase subunit beta [Lysinibacillus endophyticus]|uniref:Phenylalanine--tRNA ligase beta subunit n=1 Tax=Ureibacillus endophyticus TaxID=1978490 RepID=A0A494ZBB0_9BACL|nr:phenylalanine--tRNA ligase subunit beta [Lysinibacillus endophyticus]MCP1145520.1 phenylalanine--tRNA ligase subunit beta [Lysinibacillus endophyticus]RKQ20089.1 phenylalanine--tRNA ligase subunit beta [Lysinibacillus endophyticus]